MTARICISTEYTFRLVYTAFYARCTAFCDCYQSFPFLSWFISPPSFRSLSSWSTTLFSSRQFIIVIVTSLIIRHSLGLSPQTRPNSSVSQVLLSASAFIVRNPADCLYQLLLAHRPTQYSLRKRGHPFLLPTLSITYFRSTFINRSLFQSFSHAHKPHGTKPTYIAVSWHHYFYLLSHLLINILTFVQKYT